MFSRNANEIAPLFARVGEWWRNLRRRRTELSELEASGQDVTQIAQDVGLAASELYTVIREGRGTAKLLRRRLAALGIDAKGLADVQSAVRRDLERTCALCGSKRRCERDLATSPADPRWRAYCPNAHTLDALKAERSVPARFPTQL